MGKKPHHLHPSSREKYPGGDPWYLLPKRILFWLHMLCVPGAYLWALVVFDSGKALAYNILYLISIMGFFILLIMSASCDTLFRRERTRHAYQRAKRFSIVLMIAYPLFWGASLLSVVTNVNSDHIIHHLIP